MAQRYGRRRKAAARALIEAKDREIGALQIDRNMLRNDVRKAEERLERFKGMMSDWDADVRSMFGSYSALLFEPPELSTGFSDPEEIRRLPLPERLHPVRMLSECQDDAIAMRVAYLLHCSYRVFEDENAFGEITTSIRLRISNHKDAIYAFSEAYWRRFGPTSRREIYRLAERIAKTMMEHVKPHDQHKK